MNDIRRKLNALSGANLPDFGRIPERLKPDVVLRTAGNGHYTQVLRPIRPGDEPAIRHFHTLLSEESVYRRYFRHFTLGERIDHARLSRICTNSPDSFALVVERREGPGQAPEILTVGRLTTTDASFVAVFAILVRDDTRGRGLESIMLERLIDHARACGFKLLVDDHLVLDHGMLDLCQKSGFTLHTVLEEGLVRVCLTL